MKFGWLSRKNPFADGMIAVAYPEAVANSSKASVAFETRSLGPAMRTGLTAPFKSSLTASTAASRLNLLLVRFPMPYSLNTFPNTNHQYPAQAVPTRLHLVKHDMHNKLIVKTTQYSNSCMRIGYPWASIQSDHRLEKDVILSGVRTLSHGIRKRNGSEGWVRNSRQVAADTDIHRLAFRNRSGNCSVDELMRVIQRLNHHLWFTYIDTELLIHYDACVKPNMTKLYLRYYLTIRHIVPLHRNQTRRTQTQTTTHGLPF